MDQGLKCEEEKTPSTHTHTHTLKHLVETEDEWLFDIGMRHTF